MINLNTLTYDSFLQNFTIYESYSLAALKGFEVHHIIPKAIQRKENILDNRCIRCTAFEHTLAHYLLAKERGGEYLKIFAAFCNRNYKKLTDFEKITLENLEEIGSLREAGRKIAGEKHSLWLKEHHPMKGKHWSIEHNKKLSETRKLRGCGMGEKNGMYGKKHSLESKQKMSEHQKSRKGPLNPMWGKECSPERKKKISEANKNKKFFNNGIMTVKAATCPEGFKPGRLWTKHWFTDGVSNIMAEKCPDGFHRGRTL